ncbi:RidA family protein [uncultured Roseibium sp.]|uniref:RidA family protein n=1 Tax=uncultured Roseibium sp. TaxID=1936171 RepID=UPI003216A04D
MSSIEQKIAAMGIRLPEAPRPLGNFAPYLVDGDYLYISGQISVGPDGQVLKGKLGQDLALEEGIEAARYCGIGILARAKAAVGDLDKIEKLIKLGAFVNATHDFPDHPKVVNGASDLMVEIFGAEKADHVRFAVGSASLPSNAAVEIEAVFRIRPDR